MQLFRLHVYLGGIVDLIEAVQRAAGKRVFACRIHRFTVLHEGMSTQLGAGGHNRGLTGTTQNDITPPDPLS